MMVDGSGWAWVLFSMFVAMTIAGLALGLWAFSQPGHGSASAHEILDARLARGEITVEEHAARRRVLGAPRSGATAPLRRLALVLGFVGLVGALVVPAVGWGGDDGWWGHMRGGSVMDGSMMRGSRTSGSAPAPVREARELRVSGTEFAFSPDEVRVEAGETVNLVFDNEGAVYHTLAIPEFDFELTADGGERAEGALRASTPGAYELVCAVPGHVEAGMRGRLVVEEAGA